MTKENLLVTLADKNYIDQAKQLFSSVYWNAGWKGDYMLLAHEIPEKDLKWFRNKGILIKKCKPLYDKKIGKNKYPPVVLDKFYLFTPEFKKWKHVIFLDADIIVRASLDKLTKVKGFGAVKSNIKLSHQFLRNTNLYNELRRDYILNINSFNTGMLTFLTNTIQKDTFSRLMDFFQKYKNISLFVDEGIFNLIFYKRWKNISQIFDLDVSFLKQLKLEKFNAIILHFITISNDKTSKPWNPKNPFYKEWKYNLDRAELIDLNNIPKGKKWKFAKEIYHSWLTNFKKLYASCKIRKSQKNKTKKDRLRLFIQFSKKIIGKIGIFIKKHYPVLYSKLKNLYKYHD